jgi:hypothetical protein
MKTISLLAILALAAPVFGQRNAIDWPSIGNDAQRSGWEKSDSSITKDNVKTFQMVMKMQLDSKVKGAQSMSAPVVLGRIISYRGFKELAFLADSNDRLWSVDADMNRIFWERHFEKAQHAPKHMTAACAASVIAAPALTPPVAFGAGRGGPGRGAAPGRGGAQNAGKTLMSNAGFGAARPVFVLSNDGKLHLLNTSTGEDAVPAMAFLPNGAKATSLILSDAVVYTTTTGGCGGAPDGVWAIDLTGDEPKVNSFPAATSGIAFGTDRTVYAQTPESVVALAPGTLKQNAVFQAPGGMAVAQPVLFTDKGKERLIVAGKDGRLLVLDPKTMTKLSETEPAGEIHAGLSTWLDPAGTRWVLAPVWAGAHGKVVAYKFDDTDKLTQGWASRDLTSPMAPVITSGIVFALATGQPGGHATLYAFDGLTGAEMYSSGDQVTTPANLTGVTLANGRVFFTTTDGTLYGFGIYLER